MRRLAILLAVLLAAGGTAFYVVRSDAGWYLRLRYPLRYEQIVRAHARNYRLDPLCLER